MSQAAPEELLLDFASGALAPAPSLALSLHVALDPTARRTVERLGALGGALLEEQPETGFDEALLADTMARLEGLAVEPPARPYVPPRGLDWVPAPLAPHLPADAQWRPVLGGFEEIRLDVPGPHYRVSLLKLAPGRGLPAHRHVGEEFTVVLQGGYSDATGSYGVGDLAIGPGADRHEPIADPGEPCIALIVVERPVVLTGPIGRFFNPLVRRGII